MNEWDILFIWGYILSWNRPLVHIQWVISDTNPLVRSYAHDTINNISIYSLNILDFSLPVLLMSNESLKTTYLIFILNK